MRPTPLRLIRRFRNRLEAAGLNPDYSGWLSLGLAGFFFAAATNTLAGWLYLISGILMALLVISTLLTKQSLSGLQVKRSPLPPVHVGDKVYVAVTLLNAHPQPKRLLQAIDHPPDALQTPQTPPTTAIAQVAGQGQYHWTYEAMARRRGVYRWEAVSLRTASPLGLLWRCQTAKAPSRLIIYPQVLPLSHCSLLNGLAGLGQQSSPGQALTPATTGILRSLRPYRWGDPMRLVHWRSSARYGELRSRELEDPLGHRQITVALDESDWDPEYFEQAIIAAASLLRYGQTQQLNVQLWTASTGLLDQPTRVMEALARIVPAPRRSGSPINGPFVGITNRLALFSAQVGASALAPQCRWILWPATAEAATGAAIGTANRATVGEAAPSVLKIDPHQPLAPQLQI
ncbi:MAG: DUF58 domain-containing protein [Cyanobacteria bacterium P01_A01_bin.135]